MFEAFALRAADSRSVTISLSYSQIAPRIVRMSLREGSFDAPVYSGADGAVPPSFMGNTFSSSYSCYRVSGASVIDSLDVEEQIDSLLMHAVGQGAQLITFAHPLQANSIQGFKAGVESRPKEGAETGGPKARYDFLPSASAPPRVQMGTIVGQVAPSTLGELAIRAATVRRGCARRRTCRAAMS